MSRPKAVDDAYAVFAETCEHGPSLARDAFTAGWQAGCERAYGSARFQPKSDRKIERAINGELNKSERRHIESLEKLVGYLDRLAEGRENAGGSAFMERAEATSIRWALWRIGVQATLAPEEPTP